MGDSVVLSLVIAVLVVFAVVISVGLAVFSSRRIDHPISDTFARLLAANGLWAGCYLVMLLAPPGSISWLAVVGQGFAAALSIAAWFEFATEYTGDDEWIPDRVSTLLWLWAGGYGLARLLNPGELFVGFEYGQFGLFVLPLEVYQPGALAQFIVAYSVLLFTFVLLGRFIRRTQNLYRYQAGIILATLVTLSISTLAGVAGFQLHPQLDLTPVLYAAQGVVIWVALYRYDFLKAAPVAADRFFREMADPAIIVDAELAVIEYNEAATEVLGSLTKRASLTDIADSAFSEQLQTAIDATTPVEYTIESGDTYDIELTTVTDQFGVTQGHVIVLRDITHRKQRERQLEDQNERLEEFADVVSHDLRNPLATAEGWTPIVADSITGEEPDLATAQEGIGHIEDAHDRMDELIEVLLTMARQGQTVDDPEPVSLATVAREAWGTVATAGMELDIETDTTIAADPVRLQQAFENLFRNAAEHGDAKTVRISSLPEGFAIDDDGRGIPTAAREELFEFGYTTNEDGTGIGLAVTKRIAEAHGWQIAVSDSELADCRR